MRVPSGAIENMKNDGHPAHDHERTDVQPRVVGWMAVALAIGMGLTIPMLIVVFDVLKTVTNREERVERSPLAVVEKPPKPVLQSVPSLELGEYRQQQRELLGEYSWIDRSQQVVRIPIAEATRLIAERGLPKVPAVPVAGSGPNRDKPGVAQPAGEVSP